MQEIEDHVIQYERESHCGLKAISFAYKTIDNWDGDIDFEEESNRQWLESELTYIATAGLSDPLREGVEDAIENLTNTNVRIISGDHKLAVLAAAEKMFEKTGVVHDETASISSDELLKTLKRMMV